MLRSYLLRFVLLFVLAAGFALTDAAALPTLPVQQWVQSYNGTANSFDQAYDIEVDAAGNSYVTGISAGQVNGSSTGGDCVTIKYGPDGAQQWLARFHRSSTSSEVGYALAVDPGGNVYVTGNSDPAGSAGRELILLKYGPDGTQQWVRTFSGTGYQPDEGRYLALDSMGNPVVVGTAIGLNSDVDWMVLKYSSAGDLLWTDHYGTVNALDTPHALRVDASDQIFVCGRSVADAVVVKYTAGGTRVWVASDGSSTANVDYATELDFDGAGNVYLAGSYGRNSSTSNVMGLVKFNAAGALQWVRYYSGSSNGNDSPVGMRVDSQGNVFVGVQSWVPSGNTDVVTLKYSGTGDLLWRSVYQRSSTSSDVPVGLDLDAAGQPWIVAQSTGTMRDVTALKYDGEGNLLWATHYNGPGNNEDFPYDFALRSDALYITGATVFSEASNWDYLTLKLVEPPVAAADSYSLAEDEALDLASPGVLGNDTDPQGDPLSAVLVSGPSHGTLQLRANGSFRYVPDADYTGDDSFSYQASDGSTSSSPLTVTLTISAVNDAPVAQNDSYGTDEDQTLTVATPGVLGNDLDVEGNPVTASLVSEPNSGTLQLHADGSFQYTPAPDFHGPMSFTYRVNDGTLGSNVATVSLTIRPVNDPPTAAGQDVTTSEDTACTVTLAGADIDGDPLSYVVVGQPAHGTLTGSAPNLTYTPATNYFGPDSFTFRVEDGTVQSGIATVGITVTPVNDAPMGLSDSYRTDEDAALVVTAAQGVLLNDGDTEGDLLTASVKTLPAHGTVVLMSDGAFTYTPAADYHGPDQFTYRPSDDTAAGNETQVDLVVSPVNDAPKAASQAVSTEEDTPLPLTLSGTDVDGDSLTYGIVTPPAHGTLSGTGANRTYTPAANYVGPDQFTFRVHDGTVDSPEATVSLTITPVNDAPVASDQSRTTNEDTALSLTLGAADVEGDPLTYTRVSGPLHGTVTGTAPFLTYSPQPNYSGSDSFTFRVNDGTADSNTASVSLTVLPVNDVPVVRTDAYSGTEDAVLTVPAPGVLANDTDVDGDFLAAELVASPHSGTLTLNADGGFRYSPNPDFRGTDSFTYRAGDGQAFSEATTVTLTVVAVNDAPVAVGQSLSTPEDTAQPLTLSGTDVDGDPLTYQVVTGPAHGTLTGTPPHLTYRPATNYAGSDSFTFRVSDGTATSASTTVSITVTPVNDAPVAVAESYTTTEDEPLDQAAPGVLGNDGDVDGDSLSAVLESSTTHGTLMLGADGSFRYTPNPNFAGEDQFRYRAEDGVTTSAPVTVSLQVLPVNDPPVANAQQVTTPEDTPAGVTLTGSDVDGDALTYEVLASPQHGTLTGTPPSVTYHPAPDYSGPDFFTFRVNDGTAPSTAARIDLQVSPLNDPPVAREEQYEVAEDTALTVTSTQGLLVNDTDAEGDPLAATLLAGPAHGLLMLQADGSFTYVPASDYSGPDQFTYRCADGQAQSAGTTVTLLVTPVNDPPVSQAGSVTLNEDTPVAVTLAAVDVDGDPLTYRVTAPPAHGTLTGTAPNLIYTPNPDYSGPDQFSFRAGDGVAESNAATVTLAVAAVNDAPVAAPDQFQAPRATELVVAAPGLLGNDTDVEGDALRAVLVSGPAQGQLELDPDGSFRYVPRIGFSGTDQFTYRTSDGPLQSEPATVQIVVSDAPPASTSGKVTGKGNLGTGPSKATFTLQAQLDRRGRLKGQFTYQHKSTRQKVKSTRLTALVITGNRARVFGKARVNGAGEFDFVVEVFDGGKPSTGVDELALEVASGPSVLPTQLASGKVQIQP